MHYLLQLPLLDNFLDMLENENDITEGLDAHIAKALLVKVCQHIASDVQLSTNEAAYLLEASDGKPTFPKNATQSRPDVNHDISYHRFGDLGKLHLEQVCLPLGLVIPEA